MEIMADLKLRTLARVYAAEPTSENAHQLAREYLRGAAPEQTRKILISYGFGAGWSTWAMGVTAEIMLSHEAVIASVEAGEQLSETHPSIVAMVREIEAATGGVPYLGGLEGLSVVSVEGPFSVEEYDGSESVRTMSCLRH